MSLNVYFGRVVKELRLEKGLSQEAFAERADLNRTYLGEVERGIAIPSLVTITKIASALNVSLSALIARSEHLFEKTSMCKCDNLRTRESSLLEDTGVD